MWENVYLFYGVIVPVDKFVKLIWGISEEENPEAYAVSINYSHMDDGFCEVEETAIVPIPFNFIRVPHDFKYAPRDSVAIGIIATLLFSDDLRVNEKLKRETCDAPQKVKSFLDAMDPEHRKIWDHVFDDGQFRFFSIADNCECCN